ncbi:MAG: hypothetical protein ABIR79_07840 [Candidatus Binatia bacterium]
MAVAEVEVEATREADGAVSSVVSGAGRDADVATGIGVAEIDLIVPRAGRDANRARDSDVDDLRDVVTVAGLDVDVGEAVRSSRTAPRHCRACG